LRKKFRMNGTSSFLKHHFYLCLGVIGISTASPAAAVTLGAIDFADTAFADSLEAASGTFIALAAGDGGSIDLATAVLGGDASDSAFCTTPAGCSFSVAFTDNAVVNLAGPDLAVFELGTPQTFGVEISGVVQNFLATDTGEDVLAPNLPGFPDTFDLLVALIDLDDFGIAEGVEVTSVRLLSLENPFDPTVIAAVPGGVVPEPAVLLLWMTLIPALFVLAHLSHQGVSRGRGDARLQNGLVIGAIGWPIRFRLRPKG